MKIYGVMIDGGDGSVGLDWNTQEAAEYLLDGDHPNAEYYFVNDGCAVEITIPEGCSPTDLGVKKVWTLEAIKEEENEQF